jgi:hypothetical protein
MTGKAIFVAEIVFGTVVSDQLAPIDFSLCRFYEGDTREYLYVNSFSKKNLWWLRSKPHKLVVVYINLMEDREGTSGEDDESKDMEE